MFIDIFIIVLFLWSFYSGWKQGFLKEIVSACGFLLGLLVAATCYSQLGDYLTRAGSQLGVMTNILAFLLLWIIVPIVFGFIANVATKAMKKMKVSLPNSLCGALVSVLKYVILISCIFNVMEALHIMDETKTADSRLYQPAKGALSFLFNGSFAQSLSTDSEAQDTLWVDMTNDRNV